MEVIVGPAEQDEEPYAVETDVTVAVPAFGQVWLAYAVVVAYTVVLPPPGAVSVSVIVEGGAVGPPGVPLHSEMV